tara:strand:+ start:2123 stop:3106 length:984 start_codon:yes stop_codon:yes gene_type:complete
MSPCFFKNLGPINISIIKNYLNCQTNNISHKEQFDELVGLDSIKDKSISFLNEKEELKKEFPNGSAIICSKRSYDTIGNNSKTIVVKNVQESVAILSNIFYRNFNKNEIQQFNEPKFGVNCSIKNTSKIENGAIIGDNVIVGDNNVIGENCIIGNNTIIGSNNVITSSIIENDVKIENNCSIGQKGFGFFIQKNKNIEIFHIGRVVLRSNVSIGSNCSIDRGSFSDTIIGNNTYLDNLCHIAHNVQIGCNSVFAAMTGVAGSTQIGNNVLTGGQVGIAGHIKIGNNVQIAAKSGVFNNIEDGQTLMGNPAINKYKFIRNYKKIYGNK